MNSDKPQPAIDRPYDLTAADIDRFRTDGFVKLGQVFDAATLDHYGDEITRITLDANPHKDTPLEQRGTYQRAFIQVMQLWRRSELARAFSFSRRLARIAADLLGVRGVRMYHDQALYKEPGGGHTPWHVDQQYWPMASELCVTAWIPLQAVPLEMGSLGFVPGSHRMNIGRSLAISDDSERLIARALAERELSEEVAPYELGDVSFHYGWTLHRAGPNHTDRPRKVHTVIYMDRDMRLAQDMSDTQRVDWETFSPSTRPGDVMDDELNPVLYSVDDSSRTNLEE